MMSETAIRAGDVYQILVEECGASERPDAIAEFMHHYPATEFRFMGDLGFGGKIWCQETPMRVSCYYENETPERRQMIERANARLASLNGSSTHPSDDSN